MSLPSETRFQIAVLTETRDGADKFDDLAPVEWLSCRQSGDSALEFYKGDSLISSVQFENARFDLPRLIGILVTGSADTLDKLQRKWESALPTVTLPFKRVPKLDNKAILRAALECFSENFLLAQQHSGRASLELSTYRQEFDRLQRNFVRLEDYIGRHAFQRPIEIFEYTPDSITTLESGRHTPANQVPGFSAGTLIQNLPIDSLGVSSLSIYINSKPDNAGELLHIRLKAIESGNVLGEWFLSSGDIQTGWVELALQNAIDEPALSLVVIIGPLSGVSGWAVALGPPHPYKEYCAQTQEGVSLGAPMGIRITGGLPGIRVAPTIHAIKPVHAPYVLSRYIPYEMYGSVEQVLPPFEEGRSRLVFYEKNIGCITVHPHSNGLSVGRLNIAVPKHAWRISAQIHLAHEKASPTDFGIMVSTPQEEQKDAAKLNQLNQASSFFSGWKNLSSLETGNISVVLAPSEEQQLFIYLVTKQAPDLSPDFAWARFSKLEFNILPQFTPHRDEAHAVTQPTQSPREYAVVTASR